LPFCVYVATGGGQHRSAIRDRVQRLGGLNAHVEHATVHRQVACLEPTNQALREVIEVELTAL
jgi:hypothetical protein